MAYFYLSLLAMALGSPIGSSKHILEGKFKKVSQTMEKFEQLDDPQVPYSF